MHDRLPGLEDALRAAQVTTSAQRSAVAGVQQQIQLLASDSRNLEDQRRQHTVRRDKLAGEKSQLAAPDVERLERLRGQSARGDEASALADERLAELGEQVPALDEARRAAQAELNAQASRQADLSARLDALRALQEKVQTEGKLRPWLPTGRKEYSCEPGSGSSSLRVPIR